MKVERWSALTTFYFLLSTFYFLLSTGEQDHVAEAIVGRHAGCLRDFWSRIAGHYNDDSLERIDFTGNDPGGEWILRSLQYSGPRHHIQSTGNSSLLAACVQISIEFIQWNLPNQHQQHGLDGFWFLQVQSIPMG